MLREVFLLIVSKNYDREPIEFSHYPTEEEIKNAILEKDGLTARVEKRYVIK